MTVKNHNVLIVIENDPSDVLIFKRVLRDLRYNSPVIFVPDGKLALEYIDDPDNAKPWLIFLDLNIPVISGRELLSHIKQNDHSRWIPVVVISSSENPDDIMNSLKLGACGYLQKEFDYEAFKRSIRLAIHYWSIALSPVKMKPVCLLDEWEEELPDGTHSDDRR